MPENMMQYFPWLLIGVGMRILAATLIVSRFAYLESD
jgi:hypothetical protein